MTRNRREDIMPVPMQTLLKQYTENLKTVYGNHLKVVILYDSYARGDYRDDSGIGIMILLDLSDMDTKKYQHQLSDLTYDFNMDNDLDIKPIAKSKSRFEQWLDVYPFYTNVAREGVRLFGAA